MQEAIYWQKKKCLDINPSSTSPKSPRRSQQRSPRSPRIYKSSTPNLARSRKGSLSHITKSLTSLAASDGELETQGDEVIGSKGGNFLDVPGRVPSQKNVGRVSSWAVGFERLLQDEQGLECFTQFLKKEFSEENIMFWIACEKMGKIHDKLTLEKYAQEIYEIYLSPKATSPVNLEGQCRELIEEAIKNPTPEMFRSQQQQIFKLMKFDSYSRFLKSKMYQDCVLAEMAGEPLPISLEKRAAVDDKANKKKAAKKNKKNRNTSDSSQSSVTSDHLKQPRRPVLPWNRGKGMTKKSSGDLSMNSQDDDTISRTSSTSDAGDNIIEMGTHGKYQKYTTAVRFVFPNNDTVTLPARSGTSVRDTIAPLCEARGLPIQALEIFQSESKELVDLDQELSTLAGAEVIVERRIIFKIELPNHRVIGVKSKPTKKIIEVLRPVTYKYKLMLDSLVVHLSDSPVPLDLDITVASLDSQRILIESMEQYSAGTYKPQNGNGRLLKAASMESIISQKVEKDSIKQKEANNNNTISRSRASSSTSQQESSKVKEQQHNKLVKSPSVDLNPKLAGIKKRGNLRVTGQETEDLIAQLSKAQSNRLDDQRGLTLRNLELPDFLKEPQQKPTTSKDDSEQARSKTSLGAPYMYDMPEFLKTYEASRTAARDRTGSSNGRRPKSTPPANFSTKFNEGTIPTHEEAEALFGGGGTSNDSISHMHFNDSMMNLNMADGSGRPSHSGMRESGVSFHSTTSSRPSSQGDQFSPRSYDSTLQRVEEHRTTSAGNLQWDYSDVIREESNDNGGDDADRTLVGGDIADNLPPPPDTPVFNQALEFANYSPPPPVSARTKQLTKRLAYGEQQSKPQGATIPGHNYNQNHNQPESNLEDPMLRYYNDRSPGPPSPSTHDLVISPGGSDPYSPDSNSPSGDHDPYFAEGSQQSCSTGSTVTESSVHFGNSSYSGHSTYSSNSSQQSRTSAAAQPPPPPPTRPALYPRSTSDPQFRTTPSYNRAMSSLSAPKGVGMNGGAGGKSNPTRPRYPPPVKPKPQKPQADGGRVASGGVASSNPSSSTSNPRVKGRTEMVVIAKDGRKMRASFV